MAGALIATVIVPGVGMISIDETRLVAAVTGMYILMQDVENLGTINDRLQFGVHCFFSSCPWLISARRLTAFRVADFESAAFTIESIASISTEFFNKHVASIKAVIA
jgi:hypothetical protein